MKTIKFFWIFLLMMIAAVSSFAQQNDALLEILQSELNKNKAQFDKDQAGVYLLSYRVDDKTTHYIGSSFGSLVGNRQNHERILTVQVRVGNFEMDNFHELRDDYSDYFIMGTASVKLPLTDDSKAIAQILWRETDKAFREAKQRYDKVKANIAVKAEEEDHAPDYSAAAREVYFEPAVTNLELDETLWIQRLKELSAVFNQNKDAQEGSSMIRFTILRKYFVNSENTNIVQNNTFCHLFINVEGQATDGMYLPLYQSYFAHTPHQLPDQATMLADAQVLNNKISQLVKAPVVDPYTGPALLSKEAAGVFFHEIFGHRVEGQRLKQSTDGQTFKQKLNEQVLPTDLSVIFDPSILFYKDIPLNGSYKYDDEGFFGYQVKVVDHGILKKFLMTRTPIDSFPLSNGHARSQAGQQPVSRQSNLIVETEQPYTDEQLRAMLIAEAKAQGKEYGYLFASVQGGFTSTGRYTPNAFNVTPLEVYRIYVDGRPDELVRGVDLVGTPLSMFSKIEAAGNEHGNFAGTCGAESGWVPVGCCSPALFIKQIEMQKKSKSQQRPPIIPKNYSQISNTDNFETTCFEAMEDELEQNMTSLQIKDLQAPYFISYLISDATITSICSSLGGIITSFQRPCRDKDVTVLVGNDKRNNLHYFDMNSLIFGNGSGTGSMPIDNDYYNIRYNLWLTTDNLYKTNAEQLEAKNAAIEQQNLPQKQLDMPDRSAVACSNFSEEQSSTTIDRMHYETIIAELSNIFSKYPEFTNSGVNLYAYQGNAYYRNSEGLQYKQPFNLVGLHIYANTLADDGEPLSDELNIYRKDISQLPSVDELRQLIKDFAEQLDQLRKAPVIDAAYSGPILFADDAVATLVEESFFQTDNGLLASRKPIFSSPEISSMYGHYADKDNTLVSFLNKKVISRDLSIRSRNTLTQYNGIPLIGSFQHDADGYASDDETLLIEDGVLMQLLNNREPADKAPFSNGHNRLVLSENKLQTSLAPGVIEMSSKNKSSYQQIKKKLIALAKSEDYEYGYIITKIDNISEKSLIPTYCYQINVKTGEEKLVRMAQLSVPKLKTFKHVVSVSSEQKVFNTLMTGNKINAWPASSDFQLYGVPVSFILPKAILFEELEVDKNPDINLQKKPFIDNPLKD